MGLKISKTQKYRDLGFRKFWEHSTTLSNQKDTLKLGLVHTYRIFGSKTAAITSGERFLMVPLNIFPSFFSKH